MHSWRRRSACAPAAAAAAHPAPSHLLPSPPPSLNQPPLLGRAGGAAQPGHGGGAHHVVRAAAPRVAGRALLRGLPRGGAAGVGAGVLAVGEGLRALEWLGVLSAAGSVQLGLPLQPATSLPHHTALLPPLLLPLTTTGVPRDRHRQARLHQAAPGAGAAAQAAGRHGRGDTRARHALWRLRARLAQGRPRGQSRPDHDPLLPRRGVRQPRRSCGFFSSVYAASSGARGLIF